MTDPKPRSAFLPIMLLVAGVVVCAVVLVVVFVPLAECPVLEWHEYTQNGEPRVMPCSLCFDSGKVPFLSLWFPPEMM